MKMDGLYNTEGLELLDEMTLQAFNFFTHLICIIRANIFAHQKRLAAWQVFF